MENGTRNMNHGSFLGSSIKKGKKKGRLTDSPGGDVLLLLAARTNAKYVVHGKLDVV